MYCQLFSFITMSNIMQAYQTPIPFWNCTVKKHIQNATVRQKMHGLWLHELKPFKTDRLYSSCTIFKALALVYTRAYLSLLPSILGIFFLSPLIPVSHIVQFMARGCWGARLQILTFAMRLIWNCRKYAQKTYRSRWLLRSRWATS